MDVERSQSRLREIAQTAALQLQRTAELRKRTAELRKRTAELRKRTAELRKRTAELRKRTAERCSVSQERSNLSDKRLAAAISDLEESRTNIRRVNMTLSSTIHPYTDYRDQNLATSLPVNARDRHLLHPPTQRAACVLQPPSGRQWVHELNHCGHRLMCRRQGREIAIIDSRSRERSDRFPSLVQALLSLNLDHVQIDGVAVVMDDNGLSSTARIDEDLARGDDSHVRFLAFDLLWLDGEDLGKLSLLERKKHLRRVLPKAANGKLAYTGHLRQNGARMLQQAALLGLEGIISKLADAPYRAGLGLEWQMTRCVPRLRAKSAHSA